jgi:hypothetical protein
LLRNHEKLMGSGPEVPLSSAPLSDLPIKMG